MVIRDLGTGKALPRGLNQSLLGFVFLGTIMLVMATGCLGNQVAGNAPAETEQARTQLARIAGTAHYVLDAAEIDQRFSIDVWKPIGTSGPLPVVYLTDANLMFGIAAQMLIPMVFAEDVPPLIVVGIGYETDSPLAVASLRTRDFLPTYIDGYAERMESVGMPLPEGVRPGGADAFLAFIENEVKPFVAERYEVDPGDETLVGDSYGGTFAMHVLLNATESFDRYVIGSPVLTWDEDLLFAQEEAFAAANSTMNAKVFLSVGGLEIENGIRVPTERMMAILAGRGYEGLDLKTMVFEDETHQSVIPGTLSRGLRAVFDRWSP